MITKTRSALAAYQEHQRLSQQVDALHCKVFVKHLPLDTADWLAVQALHANPVVLADWALAGPLEELRAVRKPGVVLTAR